MRWLVAGAMALLVSSCSLLIDSSGLSGDAPRDDRDGSINPADVVVGAEGSTDATASDAANDAAQLDPYPRAVLEDKPILYYRLEETSGMTVKDEMNRFPGAAEATVTRGAPGAFAKSLGIALNGTSGSVVAGDAGNFIGNQEFSLECWVKPEVTDSVFRHPFNKDYDVANQRQQYGLFVYQGKIVVERWVDDSGINAESTVLPINEWYYVVGTYDGTKLALYIDGVLVRTTSDIRSAKPKPVPLYIAAHSANAGVLKGSLDEVAVYDKALTGIRVKAHFDAAQQQ